jgi:hypothetical protein
MPLNFILVVVQQIGFEAIIMLIVKLCSQISFESPTAAC